MVGTTRRAIQTTIDPLATRGGGVSGVRMAGNTLKGHPDQAVADESGGEDHLKA